MTMTRKFLTMTLAATLVATSLVGCSSNQVESSTGTTEQGEAKVEPMSMVAIINGNVNLDDTVAYDQFLQDGKFAFEIQSLDRNVMDEKINIMLSTNAYPDVFYKMGFSKDEVEKYGMQGIFIPLNDLIEEYAPNLTKLMEERPIIRETITSADGNIYALPGVNLESVAAPGSMWINQEWLNRLELDMPTNMDEVYEVLKAFKEQDANGNGDPNDEIPYMIANPAAGLIRAWLPQFGQRVDIASQTVEQDGKLVSFHTMDVYKESLAWLTKVYAEGLMEPNVFVNNINQAQAIGTVADVTGLTGAASPITYTGSDNAEKFVGLPAFYEDAYYRSSGVAYGTMTITDTCKTPELAIQWADQFYDEENAKVIWMGVEGVNYEYTNDEKTEFEWILEDGETVTNMRQKYCFHGTYEMPSLSPEIYTNGTSDAVQKITLAARDEKLSKIDEGDYFPILNYTADEIKEIATLMADLTPYLDNYTSQVAAGGLDLDSTWDDYVATLNQMGMERVMELRNAAYDRAKATE